MYYSEKGAQSSVDFAANLANQTIGGQWDPVVNQVEENQWDPYIELGNIRLYPFHSNRTLRYYIRCSKELGGRGTPAGWLVTDTFNTPKDAYDAQKQH